MRIALLITLYLIAFNLKGQETDMISVKLHLLSKVETDGIKLRWACDNPVVWQQGLSKGYILERARVINGVVDEYEVILDSPIKLTSKEAWSRYESSSPLLDNSPDSIKYAHISYGLAEEDIYLDGTESFAEQMEYKEALQTKFVYALLSADLSWKGAVVQGLAFYDKSVADGETYNYRLSPNFELPGFRIVKAEHEVTNELQNSKYLHDVNIIEKDSELTIKWANLDGIGGANIEYSIDGSTYIRDNTSPFYLLNSSSSKNQDSISYSIDSLTNDVEYFIKISGTTPFGDVELLGVTKGTPRDMTPPNRPIMLGVKQMSPNSAVIQWKMSDPIAKDLKGFVVGRGNEDFGKFYKIHEGIIPADWSSFEDKYFELDTTNYYIVEAVDFNGNSSRSNSAYLTLVDSIPPEIPIPISGVMDSLGIVTLELEPQEERDFMGYRIYKANDPEHEFSVVQETYNDTIVAVARNPIIIDTSTLESLTPFIYYHVTALDYHYNESQFSEMIKVLRPDKYPPVPPLISDYKITDEGIIFTFIASTSKDVAKNTVYLKPPNGNEWVAFHSFYQDTTLLYVANEEVIGMLEYAANAEDRSGLVSEYGNILKIKSVVKPKVLELDLKCTYYSESKLCFLEWQVLDKNTSPNLYHSVSYENNQETKSLGRSRYSNGCLFSTTTVPSKIAITSRSQVREYLPYYVTEGCKVSSKDISKNDLQSKLSRDE